MSKKFQWGQTSIRRMDGVDPRIIRVLFRAIRIMSRKKDGIDITIPWMGGIRTADQQNKLFLDGVSKCDGFEKSRSIKAVLRLTLFRTLKGSTFTKCHQSNKIFFFTKLRRLFLKRERWKVSKFHGAEIGHLGEIAHIIK